MLRLDVMYTHVETCAPSVYYMKKVVLYNVVGTVPQDLYLSVWFQNEFYNKTTNNLVTAIILHQRERNLGRDIHNS